MIGSFGVTQEDLKGVLDTSKVSGDVVSILVDMVRPHIENGALSVENYMFCSPQLDSIFRLLMAGY